MTTEERQKVVQQWLDEHVGRGQFYETQERAMAPGIADGWPAIIKAPHSPHGRLKLIPTADLVPSLEAMLGDVERRSQEQYAKLPTMLRLIEFYSRPENHAPCRSGGIDEGGVCPNVCICGWTKLRDAALREASRLTKRDL